jgi:hypothetical protein
MGAPPCTLAPLRAPMAGETALSYDELMFGLAAGLIGAKGRIGIYTVDDLRQRCVVDEFTGCWTWPSPSKDADYPTVALPALAGKRVSLGVAICVLRTGQPPRRGECWFHTCQNTRCANPAHRKVGGRSQQMLAHQLKRSPLTRARMSRGRRRLVDDADIAQIAGSTDLLTTIAQRYGISKSWASILRRGKINHSGCAPGATVFNLGQGA